jgi:hypothetical protein
MAPKRRAGGHLVVATFTAESVCSGGAPAYECSVILRTSTAALYPQSGSAFGFDAVPTSGNDFYESHAVTRFICLNGGASGTTYRIYVDMVVPTASTSFTVSNWTLKLEHYHGCATS